MPKKIDCRLKINKSKKSCINKTKTRKSNKSKKSYIKKSRKTNKSKKSTKKSTKKSKLDKYIDKVLLVKLPNNKRRRYRWITRKNDKGRYYARAPKIGILLKNLNLKRNSDYNKETMLPVNTIINY